MQRLNLLQEVRPRVMRRSLGCRLEVSLPPGSSLLSLLPAHHTVSSSLLPGPCAMPLWSSQLWTDELR